MKMYVIGSGRMLLDKSGLLDPGPGAASAGTVRVDIPVCTYLFDSPEGFVLFDTACDPEGMSKNWPEYNKQVSPHEAEDAEQLPQRLRQLGIAPDDIRFVVLSHLHTDHAGCLKLFKKAVIYVSERELMEATKQYALRQYRPAYIESDIRGWLDAGLRWRLVSPGEREVRLLEGLTIVNFGIGHTYGMMGLLAELQESGNFLIVADALYTKENLGPPVRLPGMVLNAPGYLRTAEFIREYAEEHHASILFGHDKAQFDSLIKSTEGFYS